MMKYIYYKKKLINGKKRRIYKKKGSKNLYLKHKGRMVNVVKYKKYLKRKQKGGLPNFKAYTFGQRAQNMRNNAIGIKGRVTDKYNARIQNQNNINWKAKKNAPSSNPYMVKRLNQAQESSIARDKARVKKSQQGNTKYGIW
jgi:hypothetical protein